MGHQQEVCGLKWSPSGNQLASGGNDNLLHIWQQGQSTPVHSLAGHQAAVKALAWCPFQSNLLATGGGTADRSIKFWNTHTGALLNSIDTGSQVRAGPPPSCTTHAEQHCGTTFAADGKALIQTTATCRVASHLCVLRHGAVSASHVLLRPRVEVLSAAGGCRCARCSGTSTSARSCPATASARTSCASGGTPP